MSSQKPLRAIMSLFLIALLALLVFQADTGAWAASAVITAGIGTLLIYSLFSGPEPLQVSAAPATSDNIDAAVINAITEPILLVVDNRVRVANVAARNMLGGHIIGEDVRLAIRHPSASARLAADANDGSIELIGIGRHDQRVELNVATIRPGTRVIHLIDRGARHAVEQARTDFVANASHELRTPLAAILGFIETLDDEKAGGDPAVRARFLDVMMKEARRMQRLIDDLISLSRIESEKYDLPAENVPMALLIREVANELRDQQGDRPTPIMLDVDVNESAIIGDRAQLSQLVHNLAGNAIKYGRPGTPIKITLISAGGQVRLTVADEGEGIAPEHLPRLTERFYRADAGRSRTMGGTGLGLAIVKHIVERHRGRMEIASKVGVGTTVSVMLPATEAVGVTEASPN